MPRQGICQAATAAHLTFVKYTCQRAVIGAHTRTEPSWIILVLTLKDNRGWQIWKYCSDKIKGVKKGNFVLYLHSEECWDQFREHFVSLFLTRMYLCDVPSLKNLNVTVVNRIKLNHVLILFFFSWSLFPLCGHGQGAGAYVYMSICLYIPAYGWRQGTPLEGSPDHRRALSEPLRVRYHDFLEPQ